MQETFNYILSNYFNAKKEAFGGHAMANYMRKNAVQNILNNVEIDISKYKVKGSSGQTKWAHVPWIAIFDRDITITATKGYDIVYLFCADMTGVYISLNQGWTYFKEKYGIKKGRQKIEKVSSAWKGELSSTLTDFSFDPIQLKNISNGSDLAEGYELGHICGKFYEAGKIPNDTVLVEDLRNLMGVYRELKGKLKENSIEKTNNYLIASKSLGLLNEENNEDDINDIEDIIEGFKQSTLIEEEVPQDFLVGEEKVPSFTPSKNDFLKKARTQKVLGFSGELMVLNYEREELNSKGMKHLAEKVRHVSEEDGDGAGYDILSFELDGTKKYIEVKTTTGGKTTPFIVTENEVKFSELNSSNYYLYRVFDFDKKNSSGKLFIIKGDISQKLEMRPQQYVVKGIVKSNENNI